jgi:hypothetical protein
VRGTKSFPGRRVRDILTSLPAKTGWGKPITTATPPSHETPSAKQTRVRHRRQPHDRRRHQRLSEIRRSAAVMIPVAVVLVLFVFVTAWDANDGTKS